MTWRMAERCAECPFATTTGTIRTGLRGSDAQAQVIPEDVVAFLRGTVQPCHMAIQRSAVRACAGAMAVQAMLSTANVDEPIPPVHLPRLRVTDQCFDEVLRLLGARS